MSGDRDVFGTTATVMSADHQLRWRRRWFVRARRIEM